MRFATSLLALAFAAPLAFSQTSAPAAPPVCDGSVNIIRVSEIKPGMFQKFSQAVAAQAAWYKGAGAPDQISMMRVIERDDATKTSKLSETQAVTSHIVPYTPDPKRLAHDAAWDAFVAMFRDSSTIKTEIYACIPKAQ